MASLLATDTYAGAAHHARTNKLTGKSRAASTQARMLEKGPRAHDLFPPRGPRMREACHAADRPSHMVGRRPHEDLDRGRVAVARVEVVSMKQAYGVSIISWHDEEQRLLR